MSGGSNRGVLAQKMSYAAVIWGFRREERQELIGRDVFSSFRRDFRLQRVVCVQIHVLKALISSVDRGFASSVVSSVSRGLASSVRP